MLYGPFAHAARWVYKSFAPYTLEGYTPQPDEPSVYVVHHKNLSGPIHAILTLPEESHLWVYRVFFERRECFKQYRDYTFTKRFGMPRALATPAAWLLSRIVPGIMHSFAAIPVHRDSRNILDTFKQSHSALLKGESLIICPDVNYDSSSEQMGEIYTGFFHLEKMYFKATGKHLAFVPVSYNKTRHVTTLGQPVTFNDNIPYNEQKGLIATTLTNAINQMVSHN